MPCQLHHCFQPLATAQSAQLCVAAQIGNPLIGALHVCSIDIAMLHACLQNVCPNGVPTIMGGQKGGFAERIRANAALAQVIPPEIDPAEAAPLLCAGVTVWAPISRYVTRPGMKVARVPFARSPISSYRFCDILQH